MGVRAPIDEVGVGLRPCGTVNDCGSRRASP